MNDDLTYKEITDQKIWDDFVTGFPRSTFILSWLWGEFQREVGNDFRYIGLFKHGELVGVLPISVIKAKRGRYLHLRHSPLIPWNDESITRYMLTVLKEIGISEGAWFIRISPLIEDSQKNRGLLASLGAKRSTAHETDAEHTLSIDLKPDAEQILAQMRKNTRYYVKKAQKIGVEVEKYNDLTMFDTFWEIFLDAVDRNKWVAYPKEYVRREFEIFSKNNMATMYLSKYQGKYISGAIFTEYNQKAFYHHSGSLSDFRNVPSTYLLIWEAMLHSKEKGVTEMNLWGVVEPDQVKHPWFGLSLFKRGFGGTESRMIHAHDLVISPLAHSTRIYELLEGKLQGY